MANEPPKISLPLAVMTKPNGTIRLDGDTEARVTLLAPLMAALRASGFLVALPVVSKVYANLRKFMFNAHGQWITSGS